MLKSLVPGTMACVFALCGSTMALDTVEEQMNLFHSDIVRFSVAPLYKIGEWPDRWPLARPTVFKVPSGISINEPVLVAVEKKEPKVVVEKPVLKEETITKKELFSQNPCPRHLIFFDKGQPDVDPRKIMPIAEMIKNCSEQAVEVWGYTYETDNDKLNSQLASARAKNVAQLLASYNIKIAKVSGTGKPEYRTDDPEKQQLNRRVEITIFEETGK